MELGAAKAGISRPGRGRCASRVYSFREEAAGATATTIRHPDNRPALTILSSTLLPATRSSSHPSELARCSAVPGPQGPPRATEPGLLGEPGDAPSAPCQTLAQPQNAPAPPPSRSSTSALEAALLMRTSLRGARAPHPSPSNSVRMSEPRFPCGR